MLFLTHPPAMQAPQGPPQGGPMEGPRLGRPGGGPPPVDIPLMRVSRQLDLNDDQKLKLQGICRAHLDALETKGLAFHQAQRALRESLQAPGVSSGELSRLIGAASSKQGELMEEVRQVTAEGWKVLTPAQQQQAKLLMSAPDPGPGSRGPGRGGPMGGPRGSSGRAEGPQGPPMEPPPEGPED